MLGHLVSAEFIRRINRFVIEIRAGDKKELAYLPNPGRLHELLLPGNKLFLSHDHHSDGLKYRVIGVKKENTNVLLDTHYTNQIARELINNNSIREFRDFKIKKEEVVFGDSRFDFQLKRESEEMLLEVKSCTLFGKEIAMFPDAISERAKRHILTLSKIEDNNCKGAILFVINSPDAKYFLPEYHTDPEFADVLFSVRKKILIKAIKIAWDENFSQWKFAGEAGIPWHVFEMERGDRGAYILGLFLSENSKIAVGELGLVNFKKGYYLYVGSAMKNLSQRVERHKRLRKKFFWHIDYLRNYCEYKFCLKLITGDRIECEVASFLGRISDEVVNNFGSSDCNCKSHLFFMENEPFRKREFVKLIEYFRIDRLQERYKL